MKKTLSMLIAVFMVMTLIAVPAMAETTTGTFPVTYQAKLDLSGYEDGTVLTNANVANTGVVSFAGTGSSRRTFKSGTTEKSLAYANVIDITNQETEGVSVATVDGEKVIMLKPGAKETNAGIGIGSISGSELLKGNKHYVYFDYYHPVQNEATTSVLTGFAKIGPDGTLTYYDVNEFAETDPANYAAKMGAIEPYAAAPLGVNNVFYYESSMTKLYYTSRMNCQTGAYLGGGAFAHGANGFLNRNGVAVDDKASIYDHWYSVRFGLKYQAGVGIQVLTQASYDVNEEAWVMSNEPYGTIPLTAEELADLKNVTIVPVVTVHGVNENTYGYIKDIRANVVEKLPQADVALDNVIMSENFEGATLDAEHQINYNGSYIAAYGTFTNRAGTNPSDSDLNWVGVTENPDRVGNPSAQVLAVKQSTNDATKWPGFRSKAIPTSAILANKDGITISYDTYRNGVSAGNGRLYFYGVDSKGNFDTGVGSDLSDATKIMAHMVSAGNSVNFTFNLNGGNTCKFARSGANQWMRIEFNIKANEAGNAVVNVRGCDLATGTWTEGTKDVVFPLSLLNYDGLVWAETYNNGNGFAYYYDNFKVYAGDSAELPEVAGSDAFLVLPTDNITATFNSIIADKTGLANIALKTADGVVVDSVITKAYVDGQTVVTIDPVDDLEADMDYVIDFGGLELVNGKAAINASFRVQEDWATIENAPEVVFNGKDTLVKGDKFTVEMLLDGSALDTSSFAVYADSDAVAIAANEDGTAYEITSVKDGYADIFVQSTLYPGAGVTKYSVESVAATSFVTVSYYDGEELLATEILPSNTAPSGYAYENENFAGWALEEGGVPVTFAPVTEDTSFYAVLADLIDIEFVINDEENGEVIDTVLSIPQGSTLEAAPEYVIFEDDYTFISYEIDGQSYTEAELLGYHFAEPTTVTVVIAKTKISIGEEYDFTTMTAEDFANSPFAYMDKDFVLTEGVGLELIKASAASYEMLFVQGEAEGAYTIEYDYIGSGSYVGFDGDIYGDVDAAQKLYGIYHTSGLFHDLSYPTAGVQSATGFKNLIRKTDDGLVHTVKATVDFETGKGFLSQDGISGIEADNGFEELSSAEAGAPTRFRFSTKTGGSLIMTRFKYDHVDAAVSQVTFEADENVTYFGMLSHNGSIITTPLTKAIPVGEKVAFGYEISDISYELDEIVATNGTVEKVDDVWYFTADGEDATVSIKTKPAIVTATFDIGEGTLVEGETEQTLVKGETPVAPVVTAPAGKIFIGWNPSIEAIYEDVDYTAVYTDAETVDIKFVAENENYSELDTTVKAIKDGNLVAVPGAELVNGSTFLYWMDEAGNKYTNEELAEKVFAGEETIKAVAKGKYINGVFDFTAHPVETFGGNIADMTTAGINTEGELSYSFNEDGSVHIKSAEGQEHYTLMNGSITGANSGVWAVTLDVAFQNGGSVNGLGTATSGNNQGMFFVGDTVYVRGGDGSEGPVYTNAFNPLKLTDGERHVVKAYYDFDNMTYRVSIDGKFGKLRSYKIAKDNLNVYQFMFFNETEADVYAFGVEKVDFTGKTSYTATAPAYEFSDKIGADAYSGVVYEGESVVYHAATPPMGYIFDGWYLNGELYTTDNDFIYVPTADYSMAPKYVEDMINFTFSIDEADADNVSFADSEELTWTSADFRKGTVPGADKVPEIVLAEGYTLVGWKCLENGSMFQPETLATNGANGSVATLVAVVRRGFEAEVSAPIVAGELGRAVEVPVSAEFTLPVAKATVEVTFDDAVLEYVDGSVAEAYAGKVVVAQTSVPNKVAITLTSDTDVELKDVLATLKFKVIEMTTGSEISFKVVSVFAAEDEVVEMTKAVYNVGIVKAKVLKGDVNLDGKIDVYDAVAVLRGVAGITSLNADAEAAADVNADGYVDVVDATTILKYVARLISNF